MASLKSFGRAGQREEEANGDLDRSLQQMLRAIVEERNRINIRQEISGLGLILMTTMRIADLQTEPSPATAC